MDWSIWWVNAGRILILLNSTHPSLLWQLAVSRLALQHLSISTSCAWVGRCCLITGFFNRPTAPTDGRSPQTPVALRILLWFSSLLFCFISRLVQNLSSKEGCYVLAVLKDPLNTSHLTPYIGFFFSIMNIGNVSALFICTSVLNEHLMIDNKLLNLYQLLSLDYLYNRHDDKIFNSILISWNSVCNLWANA